MNMPVELFGLVASVALGFAHVVLASHAASLQRGYRWTASARDAEMPPLRGVAGRLARASANYLETFPYFGLLALAVYAAGASSEASVWGVGLYLLGRVLYLPLYAFGVFLVRSLAWNIATLGIALLGWALVASPARPAEARRGLEKDTVGFAANASCQSVIDAEAKHGAVLQKKSQPTEPALKKFYGTQVFERKHNGREATVVYTCGGYKPSGGTVNMQLVYIDLDSEQAA